MCKATFPEFIKFINDALNDFSLRQADCELIADKQTLSDWWTCFSLVVVPDLLLEAEAQPPPNAEGQLGR